tara:strand:- start:3263 stop:3493 length:231 start_codon:yes stop_codon:yes gene_type:complete
MDRGVRISYLGKVKVNDIFQCQMCGHKGRDKYLATPQAVTLVDWDRLLVCKKCARREVGGNNGKGWNKIHEERADS